MRAKLAGGILGRLSFAAVAWLLSGAVPAQAFTASKVWFEALPTGIYRINVSYTVPELKEFRESYAEFRRKADAEAFYWDLLRGADFFPGDPAQRRFVQQPQVPDPW